MSMRSKDKITASLLRIAKAPISRINCPRIAMDASKNRFLSSSRSFANDRDFSSCAARSSVTFWSNVSARTRKSSGDIPARRSVRLRSSASRSVSILWFSADRTAASASIAAVTDLPNIVPLNNFSRSRVTIGVAGAARTVGAGTVGAGTGGAGVSAGVGCDCPAPVIGTRTARIKPKCRPIRIRTWSKSSDQTSAQGHRFPCAGHW